MLSMLELRLNWPRQRQQKKHKKKHLRLNMTLNRKHWKRN
jgi:hypothetical protein